MTYTTHVTFTVDNLSDDSWSSRRRRRTPPRFPQPMVVAKMPEERVRWSLVLRELGHICHKYEGRSTDISGLDEEALTDAFEAARTDPERLKAFELWEWSSAAQTFIPVAGRTKV